MAGQYLKKLKNASIAMLKNGTGVKKISLCVALGTVLGIFPVLGVPTILCAMAAVAFRLNLPAMQIVNYMVYPIQLVLLTPFYIAGNWLFGRSINIDDFQILILKLKNDFWGSMTSLWELTLYAIFIWIVICPFLLIFLYILIKPVIGSFATRHTRNKLG